MDTDGGGEADRISSLPDELLHSILLRLPRGVAPRAAVLSRRWRHVWAHFPVLYLDGLTPPPCATVVDEALAACPHPALLRLVIRVQDEDNYLQPGRGDVTDTRVAPWLRFASQRVAGEFFLWLPTDEMGFNQVLDLPVFAKARRVEIRLRRNFRLRPPPLSGRRGFAALTCLAMYSGKMDGHELGTLVSSSECPCLEELTLTVRLEADSDVSIRSGSLKRLRFHVANTRRLVVDAPVLVELCVSKAAEAYIAVPKLAVVEFRDDMDRYELAQAGRHLQRLMINLRFPAPAIMRRFDTIRELILDSLSIPRGEGYKTFMKDMSRLDCESLVIRSVKTCHGFAPSMLHLLRICTGLRKFAVTLSVGMLGGFECPSDCPCTWPENFRTDNIMLGSLEEIKVNGFKGYDPHLECVNLLLRCNAPLLKRVVFSLSCSNSDYQNCMGIIRDKIRNMLPPHVELWACSEHRNSIGILGELRLVWVKFEHDSVYAVTANSEI
ncbi:hypothetical protein ACP70R_004511 [Stipagrostis hirtigluma subsp. patula]